MLYGNFCCAQDDMLFGVVFFFVKMVYNKIDRIKLEKDKQIGEGKGFDTETDGAFR